MLYIPLNSSAPKKSTRAEDSVAAASVKPPPKSAPKKSVPSATAAIDAVVRRMAEKSAREDRSSGDDDSQAGITGPEGNPEGEDDVLGGGGELAADDPARSGLKGRALPPEVARCFAQPPEVMEHFGIREVDIVVKHSSRVEIVGGRR